MGSYKVFFKVVNRKEKVGKRGTSSALHEFMDCVDKADAKVQLENNLLTNAQKKAGWRIEIERMILRSDHKAGIVTLPWLSTFTAGGA